MGVEQVKAGDGTLLAIVIYATKDAEPGIEFFTPNDLPLQVARMVRPQGHKVPHHEHRPVQRSIVGTSEVLIIESGHVIATITHGKYIRCLSLHQGDVIVMVSGAHSLDFKEESVMLEVKQGPYNAGEDKVPVALWDGGPAY